MISARAILLFIAIIVWATTAHANVPIIVETGVSRRTVMKLCSDAGDQLRNGDIAEAKRNVDAALRIDSKLWPALYVHAQIFRRQGKYELAV
jgi:Tfp pilus assembly protein PilF